MEAKKLLVTCNGVTASAIIIAERETEAISLVLHPTVIRRNSNLQFPFFVKKICPIPIRMEMADLLLGQKDKILEYLEQKIRFLSLHEAEMSEISKLYKMDISCGGAYRQSFLRKMDSLRQPRLKKVYTALLNAGSSLGESVLKDTWKAGFLIEEIEVSKITLEEIFKPRIASQISRGEPLSRVPSCLIDWTFQKVASHPFRNNYHLNPSLEVYEEAVAAASTLAEIDYLLRYNIDIELASAKKCLIMNCCGAISEL